MKDSDYLHLVTSQQSGKGHAGDLLPISPRLRELNAEWRLRRRAALAGKYPHIFCRDTSMFTERDWETLAYAVARTWAYFESEHRQQKCSSSQVIETMATILEPYQAEETLLNTIASRVDQLLNLVQLR
jgi:hypothetical protein